jgi:glutamine amidotransferase
MTRMVGGWPVRQQQNHWPLSRQLTRLPWVGAARGAGRLLVLSISISVIYAIGMRIAILDYQAGNLTSVQQALSHLGHPSQVTSDAAELARADKVIFPGVGAAGSCMANLRKAGLDCALRTIVRSGTPLLCICVGMQLLFDRSEEDGGVDCLGVLPGTVRRFRPDDATIKVPHMGWNPVLLAPDPLWDGIATGTAFYFVHSYYCDPAAQVAQIATSDHGIPFCAGVRRGALAAVQFHPEKSGPAGLRLLDNFLRQS